MLSFSHTKQTSITQRTQPLNSMEIDADEYVYRDICVRFNYMKERILTS